MINDAYKAQVNLLLQVLPYVAKEKVFALKGGTAINLFIRNMPRLSVDIDLTYLPIAPRAISLKHIQSALHRIKEDIEKNIRDVKVQTVPFGNEGDMKLNCQGREAQIKIEVNTITRGHIFPVNFMQINEAVQEEFQRFAAIQVVSFGELYGGKICAAIDRQHPRDLFDVKQLFDNEGFTNEIWDGFLIGLLSHYKPITELIAPVFKNQKKAFDKQFSGMTSLPFTYEDYENTRQLLVNKIRQKLTAKEKEFLIGFESGTPDWNLFPHEILKDFPAIQWKLLNIEKLTKTNKAKHHQMIERLIQNINE